MNECPYDETAREIVQRWLDELGPFFGPGTRAAALLTIARVAGEMSEREEAKIPDMFE